LHLEIVFGTRERGAGASFEIVFVHEVLCGERAAGSGIEIVFVHELLSARESCLRLSALYERAEPFRDRARQPSVLRGAWLDRERPLSSLC
jgi:hypothetical protein